MNKIKINLVLMLTMYEILEGARLIGAGAATIGVIGAGVGIVLSLVITF